MTRERMLRDEWLAAKRVKAKRVRTTCPPVDAEAILRKAEERLRGMDYDAFVRKMFREQVRFEWICLTNHFHQFFMGTPATFVRLVRSVWIWMRGPQ